MYLNNCFIEYRDDDFCNVTGPCVITGKDYTLKVYLKDLSDWIGGKYIQDAMPYLSAEQREFLISGTSPDGWAQTFGEEDED